MSSPCVQVLGARAWKNPVLALLAINTAIAMKQTDGFLSTKLTDPTYSAYPGRMDTTIAGVSPKPRPSAQSVSAGIETQDAEQYAG